MLDRADFHSLTDENEVPNESYLRSYTYRDKKVVGLANLRRVNYYAAPVD
jgi:hypothetical protein